MTLKDRIQPGLLGLAMVLASTVTLADTRLAEAEACTAEAARPAGLF